MTWVLVAVLGAVVLYGLHLIALWAEGRGWIYYRTKSGRPAPWLGSLEAIYKPEVEHLIEEQSSEAIRADDDESGDRPDPGGD